MSTTKQQQAAWPRWAIAGLAACGSALTAYLTYVKLSYAKVAYCTSGAGCDLVLQSSYAELFGLPLSAFGLGLYLTMAAVAVLPGIERWRWPVLFGLSLGGVTFTAYLMYLLAYEFATVCIYCLASATLIASIFALSIFGHRWEKPDNLVLGGLGVVLAAMAGTFGVFSVQSATAKPLPYASALAKHLRNTGAKFYGASWCPHCQAQKSLFGEEAQRFVPYVECSPTRDTFEKVCRDAGIESFPTWDIAGKRYLGEQSLEQLASYSGYKPTAGNP